MNLADPRFYVPSTVDIILGADVYGRLLLPGIQRFSSCQLIAQNTTFGWVISGSTLNNPSGRAEQLSHDAVRGLHVSPDDNLHASLDRYWTLEELPRIKVPLKPDDELCERYFKDTHTRAPDGRYQIHLPVRGAVPDVGAETRRMALGTLRYMHRRFHAEPELAGTYIDFMKTYEKLGHMSRIPEDEDVHGRPFDASRRTRDKQCLNDFLFAGPPLQKDLSLILLNWRRYKYVFMADIVKMFCQIQVAPSDRDLQRILWAPNARESPVEYRLNTVTYGTTCAPFLALRTLTQLARDERHNFPLGSRCTYVDDTFAGADDLLLATRKRDELIGLLRSAGIELDKWAANDPAMIPDGLRKNNIATAKSIDREGSIKTLGVYWNSIADEFSFCALKLRDDSEIITKRSVLSNIARLFDPLGWLSPITISVKIMMQDLWILKCDWDSPLPIEMRERWTKYCDSLSSLPAISISRWLGTYKDQGGEIHGFSDASSRAYTVVYL